MKNSLTHTHTHTHNCDFCSRTGCCVFQRGFPANPSQESLSLSISGSGSLHSWNLETTEEQSDVTEDSDWLCRDTSVPEEEGTENLGEQESGPTGAGEKQEEATSEQSEQEVNAVLNGNQEAEIDNRNIFEEVKAEEESKNDGQDKTVSLAEDPESQMDRELKEKREDEQNESGGVVEGKETEEGGNEVPKGVTREDEGGEEKGEEVTGCLNKLTTLNPQHPNATEEQQGQEDKSDIVEPPAAQEKRREAVQREEWELRQTPPPPKVQSAVVRFQSQGHSQGLQLKSRAKELAEPGTPCNTFRIRVDPKSQLLCDTNMSEENNRSGGHEEHDLPPIKVSELKKRFEA